MIDSTLNMGLPRFRDNEIVIQELGDEILVYDLKTNKAHSLNPTAAFIWKNCNGNTSVEDLAAMVEAKLKLKCNQDLVNLALADLSKINLIRPKIAKSSSISRRNLLTHYGAAAIAIPVIASLVAPTAAQVASCLAMGQMCTLGSECCSMVCIESFCA